MPNISNSYKRAGRGLLYAVAISLFLHLALVPMAPYLSGTLSKANLPREEIVEIDLSDLSPTNSRPGQIVDVNTPASDQAPSNSRFLSDRNRLAPTETQARQTGPAVPAPRAASKSQPSETTQSRQTEKSDDSGDVVRSELPKQPKTPQLNTDLSQWFASRSSPQAPSNYLPGIEFGDATLLNTREYAYAPFFIRMKQGLERVWNPQRALRNANRPTRDEYRTVVNITLNADGSVAAVRVLSSSSISGLDDEAVRAIYKAAPFVNPPKDLVETDGKIHINDFHFIVSQRQTFF